MTARVLGGIFWGYITLVKKNTLGDTPISLSDAAVKQAKARDKDYKLSDREGMYLLVKSNGAKYWRFKYRYNGKEKVLALGIYPRISLRDARIRLLEARKSLYEGADPGQIRKEGKLTKKALAAHTFETIAREWWEKQCGAWSEGHGLKVLSSLETDIFPHIGNTPIAEISAQTLLALIRRVEDRGALDIASRILQRCSSVFRYAIQTGRASYNPTTDLQGSLKSRKPKHQPSLPRAELPEFLKRLKKYDGMVQTQLALKLLVLTFVRPGELRGARWEEFDLKAKEWRIPGERMKMKTEHIVPLSKQSILLLGDLKRVTGQYDLLFPGERIRSKPMSENTLLFALYRLGYKDRATPHGFRATASSILNEQNFNKDAIERQLAHLERNKIRGAYTHHAEYLKERKKIMQWWADYQDKIQ